MRMQLSIRNVSAVIANIKASDARIQGAVKKRVKRAGDDVFAVAYALCPVDTGFMQDHLTLVFTPKGFGFEVGWIEDEFSAAGLPFYPPYVVFGTVSQAPQDPLTPAYNLHIPPFQEDLAVVIRQAA